MDEGVGAACRFDVPSQGRFVVRANFGSPVFFPSTFLQVISRRSFPAHFLVRADRRRLAKSLSASFSMNLI
jgi:hypothetical protein